MNEYSNAVLSEQVRALRKDFYEYRDATKRELKDMEERMARTRELADDVSYSLKYVKKSVDKMEEMMTNFIGVVEKQNGKIDEFINSEKRMSNSKQLTVSVVQVIAGMIVAVVSLWLTGTI